MMDKISALLGCCVAMFARGFFGVWGAVIAARWLGVL